MAFFLTFTNHSVVTLIFYYLSHSFTAKLTTRFRYKTSYTQSNLRVSWMFIWTCAASLELINWSYKVLEGIFLNEKNWNFTPDTLRLGLIYKISMDLFPIIYVNFKTPCLQVNSSLLEKGSLFKCCFFVISKIDVKMKNGDRKLLMEDSFPVYLSCMYHHPLPFNSFPLKRTCNAGNVLLKSK